MSASSFLVIFFECDNTIEIVSTVKVNLDAQEVQVGQECDVPWETEEIAEDGKTVIRSKNYRGRIIWFCEGNIEHTVLCIVFVIIVYPCYMYQHCKGCTLLIPIHAEFRTVLLC